MCLAIPMKLVSINGNDAVADQNGVQRNIRVDFLHNPQVGDFIIAHAGFAIETLQPQQALDNLKAIQEVADAL